MRDPSRATSTDVTGAAVGEFRTEAEREFRSFIQTPSFSCLAAQGVIQTGRYTLGVYSGLGATGPTRLLAHDLAEFVSAPAASAAGNGLRTFAAIFPDDPPADELEFERRLWDQLAQLHDCEAKETPWDPSVSADPEDPRFAFSFGGRALFVVGLHPVSSRIARRFRWPTLVFNLHEQFEELRARGKFERLREMVRQREIALQGSLNPNLADFGEKSDARQYSGRAVEPDWKCPFHHRSE